MTDLALPFSKDGFGAGVTGAVRALPPSAVLGWVGRPIPVRAIIHNDAMEGGETASFCNRITNYLE